MIYELGAPSVAASIQPGQELLVLLGFSGLLANFAIPLPWSAPRPSSPHPSSLILSSFRFVVLVSPLSRMIYDAGV